jgi:hypothetical protein
MPVGDEQTEDDFWDVLGDRVRHPARVEIVEALRWIDRPVLTTDLLGVLDWKRIGLRLNITCGNSQGSASWSAAKAAR